MIAPAKRGVPVLLHVFAVEIISIHAPVWGRVELMRETLGDGLISIHAPLWGRAQRARAGAARHSHFNLRPRVGAGATAKV